MPRRKAPKRKIKEVIVPEGDQGQQLSAEDRKAKLESFLEQYDLQGEPARIGFSINLSILWP